MCEYSEKKEIVEYPFKFNWYTNKSSYLGYHIIKVDKCLVPFLKSVWNEGVETGSSCCGHFGAEPSLAVNYKFLPKLIDYFGEYGKYFTSKIKILESAGNCFFKFIPHITTPIIETHRSKDCLWSPTKTGVTYKLDDNGNPVFIDILDKVYEFRKSKGIDNVSKNA